MGTGQLLAVQRLSLCGGTTIDLSLVSFPIDLSLVSFLLSLVSFLQ